MAKFYNKMKRRSKSLKRSRSVKRVRKSIKHTRSLRGGINFRAYGNSTPRAPEGLVENVSSAQHKAARFNSWPWNPLVLPYDTFLNVSKCNFTLLRPDTVTGQRFLCAWNQQVQDKRDPEFVDLQAVSKDVLTEVLRVQRQRYYDPLETTYLFGVTHNGNIFRNDIWNPYEEEQPAAKLGMPKLLNKQPINLDQSMGLEVAIRQMGTRRVLYVHHIQKNVSFPNHMAATDAHLDEKLDHVTAPSISTLFSPGILSVDELIKENVVKMWWRVAVYFGKALGCTHALLSDNSSFYQGQHNVTTLLIRSIQGKAPLYDSIDVYVDPRREVKLADTSYTMRFKYVEDINEDGNEFLYHPDDYFSTMSQTLFFSEETKWGVVRKKTSPKITTWVKCVRGVQLKKPTRLKNGTVLPKGHVLPGLVPAASLHDDLTFREVFTLWYTALKTTPAQDLEPYWAQLNEDKPGTVTQPRFYAYTMLQDCVESLYTCFSGQMQKRILSFVNNTFPRDGSIYFAGEIPNSFANRLQIKNLEPFDTYGQFMSTCDIVPIVPKKVVAAQEPELEFLYEQTSTGIKIGV